MTGLLRAASGTVFTGAALVAAQEQLGKVTEMIETAGKSDLCNAFVRMEEQVCASADAVFIEKVDGRLFQIVLENGAALASAYISGGGNPVKGYFFSVVLLDIGYHRFLQSEVGMFRPVGLQKICLDISEHQAPQ